MLFVYLRTLFLTFAARASRSERDMNDLSASILARTAAALASVQGVGE